MLNVPRSVVPLTTGCKADGARRYRNLKNETPRSLFQEAGCFPFNDESYREGGEDGSLPPLTRRRIYTAFSDAPADPS